MNVLKAVNTVNTIKNQVDKIKMTTQEDAFRRALLKITNDSMLSEYFLNSINEKLIDVFLKILKELGKYSKKYVELVEKLKTVDIIILDNGENQLYFEMLNNENVCLMEGGSIETQIQKLNNNVNVNDFLNDLMIINTPIVSEKFEKILKIVGKYQLLKKSLEKTIDKITSKLEKEDEEDIRKHFDSLEKQIQTAREQIDEIIDEYELRKIETNHYVENTVPLNSFEQASANAPNDEFNNISDDFYNLLLKISLRNTNIFSRKLDPKLLKIPNLILSKLNNLVNHKKVIETYNGETKKEEKVKCMKDEKDEMDLDKMKQNILKKYENSNFEKQIIETIVKIVENIQNQQIDPYLFKKIVENSFKKIVKQIEKIINICSETQKTNEKNKINENKTNEKNESIQACIDDANLLKKEIKEYISAKKVVVVPSVPLVPLAVPSVPSVPLAVPLATGLSATNLLPNATNLSGILNKQGLENQLKDTVGSQMQDAAKQLGSLQENAGSQMQGLENQLKGTVGTQLQGLENQLKGTVGTQLQGLENQLKGTVGSQMQGLENQLKGTVGTQMQGLENQLKGTVGTQMQDAAKQLGSLQENAVSQLQGLDNQFKDASKMGEQLGSQFKDASKMGEQLGSQFKDASKMGEQLGSQFKDASKMGEQLGSQFKDASKMGEQLGSQFKDASKMGESLGSLFKKGGKRKKVTRKSSSRAFRKTRRRRQIYR